MWRVLCEGSHWPHVKGCDSLVEWTLERGVMVHAYSPNTWRQRKENC